MPNVCQFRHRSKLMIGKQGEREKGINTILSAADVTDLLRGAILDRCAEGTGRSFRMERIPLLA